MENRVTVEIIARDGEEAAQQDGEPRTYRFALGEGQAIPSVEEAIMTLAAGEEGDFEVSFPEDFPDEERRGQPQKLHIKVTEASAKSLPELDDEFAKQIGDFEDLAPLRTRILEDLDANTSISPNGRWLAWFDGEQQHWFSMDLRDRSIRNISENIPHPVHNELHDSPSLPGSYGSAGWLEDDDALLLYDRHDIWLVDPSGEDAPRNVTEGAGRRDNIRFRYVNLDAKGGGGFDKQHDDEIPF